MLLNLNSGANLKDGWLILILVIWVSFEVILIATQKQLHNMWDSVGKKKKTQKLSAKLKNFKMVRAEL